jgi:hypothetical protein
LPLSWDRQCIATMVNLAKRCVLFYPRAKKVDKCFRKNQCNGNVVRCIILLYSSTILIAFVLLVYNTNCTRYFMHLSDRVYCAGGSLCTSLDIKISRIGYRTRRKCCRRSRMGCNMSKVGCMISRRGKKRSRIRCRTRLIGCRLSWIGCRRCRLG